MKYVSNNGEISRHYRKLDFIINCFDGSKIKDYNKLINALKKIGYDDNIIGSICELGENYFAIEFEFNYNRKSLIRRTTLYLDDYIIGRCKKLDMLYYKIGMSFLSSRNSKEKLRGPISEDIKKLESILTDEDKLLIELEE